MMSSRLSKLREMMQPAAGNTASVLHLDAAAQEAAEEYITTWITNRIYHNKIQKREITSDEVYTDVIGYILRLNAELFFPRLWTAQGIENEIWTPIASSQSLLEFVYRGASELYIRVFGITNDSGNTSFNDLVKHVCDGLCVMSSKSSGLISEQQQGLFPTYNEVQNLMKNNPWLVFVYYLCRLNILELISKGNTNVRN